MRSLRLCVQEKYSETFFSRKAAKLREVVVVIKDNLCETLHLCMQEMYSETFASRKAAKVREVVVVIMDNLCGLCAFA